MIYILKARLISQKKRKQWSRTHSMHNEMSLEQYMNSNKPQAVDVNVSERIKQSDKKTTYVAEVKQGNETIRTIKFANANDAKTFANQHEKQLKEISNEFKVVTHRKKKGENLKGAITNGNLMQGEWLIR